MRWNDRGRVREKGQGRKGEKRATRKREKTGRGRKTT